MTTLEDRLAAAARTLDTAIADHLRTGSPAPTPANPRRRFVTIAAGALAVAGVAGLTVAHLNRPETTAVDVPASGTPARTIVPDRNSGVPVAETPGSIDPGEAVGWAAFPNPPLSPRFEYLSVPTADGLLVWGGWGEATEMTGAHGLGDGAYYDVGSGTWRVVPTAPLDLEAGIANGVWTGTEIVVINGYPEPKVAAFDPVAFSWRAMTPPPDCRGCNRLMLLDDGRLAVPRSRDDDPGRRSVGVMLFDPATDTWAVSSPKPGAISTQAWATDGRRIIELSSSEGADMTQCDLVVIRLYDPATDTWTAIELDSSWSPAIIAWTPAGLLLAGGVDCLTGLPVRRAFIFDPDAVTPMRSVTDLPTDVVDFSRYTPTGRGQLVAILTASGEPLIYDSSTDRWTLGASVLNPGERVGETPVVWVGDSLVVVNPGLWYALPGGDALAACCQPKAVSYVYRPDLTVAVAESVTENRSPVAVDDTYTVVGEMVVEPRFNDYDPDGDFIDLVALDDVSAGTAVIDSNGRITYTPAPGSFGSATFSYTISDPRGGSDTATVTVNIVPDIPMVDGQCAPDGEVTPEVLMAANCALTDEQMATLAAWVARDDVP